MPSAIPPSIYNKKPPKPRPNFVGPLPAVANALNGPQQQKGQQTPQSQINSQDPRKAALARMLRKNSQ